ncbi:hypothetical protein D9M69_733650 [compost metagenome]
MEFLRVRFQILHQYPHHLPIAHSAGNADLKFWHEVVVNAFYQIANSRYDCGAVPGSVTGGFRLVVR